MFSRVVKNDEYYTKKESWDDIAQYLPRDKVIWECFYSHNSKSATYSTSLISRHFTPTHAKFREVSDYE